MEKIDYLLRFRRAKSEDTLDLMYDRMMAKTTSLREASDICLAKCQRERELESGRRLNQ